MLKLYKNVSGLLHYHEAWFNEGLVTEHWGPIGTQGESREHPVVAGQSPDETVQAVLSSAFSEGFRPIEMEDHAILLIEYPVSGMGSKEDLAKRHALEEHLDETLGWTGLGFCDGGSIGSGTMEVCCVVVDFAVAKDVIKRDLADTEYSDFSRIYDESDA